jgi:hypothetical protein
MHVPNITFWYVIFKSFPVSLRPLNFVIKINKPFAVAPSPAPLAPPSFSTLAIPAHPTQSFSHPGQHHSSGVEESPQEDTQKPSKRPNKMRVNKHSITPRYAPYTTNISNIDIFQGTSAPKSGLSSIMVRWTSLQYIFRPFLQRNWRFAIPKISNFMLV